MKRYVSKYPTYALTVRVNDSLVRVKFANGVFETEDPVVQKAIESNQYFGSAIKEVDASNPIPEVKEKRAYHKNDYDPLLEVVAAETKETHAKEDGAKAKKAGKKKGSKG